MLLCGFSFLKRVGDEIKAYLAVTGESVCNKRAVPAIDILDGFFQACHSENRQDRPKDFLLHDWFPFLNISQHCGSCGQDGDSHQDKLLCSCTATTPGLEAALPNKPTNCRTYLFALSSPCSHGKKHFITSLLYTTCHPHSPASALLLTNVTVTLICLPTNGHSATV